MNNKNNKKAILNMRATLLLFAIVPMLIAAVSITLIIVTKSSEEIKTSAHNSMIALSKDIGAAFDYATEKNEASLKSFSKAPVVCALLKNPNDPKKLAAAQKYTEEYFGDLAVWEGLYIADWNSKVLTHPNKPAIGMVLRKEKDALKGLQDNITTANKAGGVLNVGIMVSPASGQNIMSMYTAVYDENKNPIGFIGGAVKVKDVVDKFSDVKALQLDSAYTYFVDKNGNMLSHPKEDKIGKPVENDAVKAIVKRMQADEKIEPACIEYVYNGSQKYSAFYVGKNDQYVAVLTADESDVMKEVNAIIIVAAIVFGACVVLFIIVAILVSSMVSKPLAAVAKATEVLSTGELSVECNSKSIIKETLSIINAFQNLKNALESSMSNVKNSAEQLNMSILNVDELTSSNVESVSQINDAINEVAETSQVVAQSAQNMAEKSMDLERDIEILTENVTGLYNSSLTIKEVNDEAVQCMKSVYNGADESVEAVQNIASVITETNTAIEEINCAVKTIESIAEETNLLSLNASIEAARAGEVGQGFAIVAQEIRKLADSSAESVKEINDIIENIVRLSHGTVEISNHVCEVISKEKEDIENAQNKFDNLSTAVDKSISDINTIKDLTGRLDDIKVEISSSTNDLGAISEQLGASAEEVASSCQTVTESCTDTQNSTEEMRTVNSSMDEAIDFFKL